MAKLILTATAILVNLLAFGQVSENRTVGDFSKLKTSHGVEVIYTVSDSRSIKVETDDNEKIKFVKTEVEGSTLKIYVDKGDGKYKGSKKGKRRIDGINFNVLKVTVSGPSLQAIKSSSSSSVKLQNTNFAKQIDLDVSSSGSISGKFNCENMVIEASSSGDLDADIQAKTIAVESSSSADVNLSGKTKKLTVKSSSSSSFKGDKLAADDVTANASSSADINLHVLKTLDARASSSADINYHGNPSQVTKDQSSSGSVNHR